MTPTTHPTEADQLRQRIAEAEQQHAEAVRAWRALARPFRDRIWDAEVMLAKTWRDEFREDMQVARRDLANLGPEPVEPIRLGMLRGRLARLEER